MAAGTRTHTYMTATRRAELPHIHCILPGSATGRLCAKLGGLHSATRIQGAYLVLASVPPAVHGGRSMTSPSSYNCHPLQGLQNAVLYV